MARCSSIGETHRCGKRTPAPERERGAKVGTSPPRGRGSNARRRVRASSTLQKSVGGTEARRSTLRMASGGCGQESGSQYVLARGVRRVKRRREPDRGGKVTRPGKAGAGRSKGRRSASAFRKGRVSSGSRGQRSLSREGTSDRGVHTFSRGCGKNRSWRPSRGFVRAQAPRVT